MKKIYRYIALAAVTIGFAACTQEEDFAPQQSDIVQIASAYIATELHTRVNTDGAGDAFEEGDAILLINTTRTNKNKGTYTYDGSGWWPNTTGGMVLWASGTNSFTAYYPASETFELPTDQSTLDGLKSADRMTAEATVNRGYAVSLSFSHVNAKVTITTSFASQYDANATISDLKIGEVTPYNSETNSYTAIIEPSDNGFTVTIQVGADYLTATSTTALVAGNHYTFNLTVGKEVVTFGEVSVEEWNTPEALTGGEATELKATCEISGTTATLTVPELAPEASFTEALGTLSAATGVTTITVDGTLTEAQQSALAIALTSYAGGIIFNDMKLADISDGIKNLSYANVVDSEGQFAYVNKTSFTLEQYTQKELTADNQRGGYIFSGGSSESLMSSSIIVKSGVHNITLQDCYIKGHASPGLDIAPGATVYLTVLGTNAIEVESYNEAAIFVPVGATLVITKESTGTLTAKAATIGAGIGGGLYSQMNESNGDFSYCSSGTITINGGTIIAVGGNNSAGIGSAGSTAGDYVGGHTCGDITINGGTVTATGGNSSYPAAGIGGGGKNPGGNITITGGTVTATGGNYDGYGGAGIGSGYGYKMTDFSYGTITITGGTVTATGGGNAAGIGHGSRVGESSGSDAGGTIIIGANATVTSNNETLSPTE